MPSSAAKPNIHLVVGEDGFLAERAVRKIFASAGLGGSPGTVEIVDGAAGNADAQLASIRACDASVRTPPFLDPAKATWWRGVSFLPGGGRGGKVSEEVRAALERFANGLVSNPPPPEQTLVISAPKCLKTSVFAKTLAPVAQVLEFAQEKNSRDRQASASSRAGELAAEEGLEFEPGADAAFVARVGTDSRTMASEIAKLRTYLGDGKKTITRADVAEVSSASADAPELWELTEAAGARDLKRLFAAIAQFDFVDSTSDAILVTTVLEKFYRELAVLRDALDRKWLTPVGWKRSLPSGVVAMLDATGSGPSSMKSQWLLQKNVRFAQMYSLRELRFAHARIFAVREALVAGGDPGAVVTELVRTVGRPRGAR